MKAIINVSNGSTYALYNGLTFEVKEVLSRFVAVDINGVTTDFSFSEVMIVDIYQEVHNLQRIEESRFSTQEYSDRLKNLKLYIASREICLEAYDDSVTVVSESNFKEEVEKIQRRFREDLERRYASTSFTKK